MNVRRSLWLLALVTFFALLLRLWRLETPATYMFDEVYHVVSAQAYARNDPAGYEWWHGGPKPGTAYEWLHPPVGKLLQALGIVLFGDNAFSWRIGSTLFGVASIPVLYFLSKRLFEREDIALMASFLWSIDWLGFVQSRIAMNDIYVTFFGVLTLWLLSRFLDEYPKHFVRNTLFVALALGLAVSTKWSGVYLVVPIGIFMLIKMFRPRGGIYRRIALLLGILITVPVAVYMLSYGQWWLQGHTWAQFEELHRQTWWYQTNLKATHPYQSAAWSWPLALRPVWIYVERTADSIGNIYAIGNPFVWWIGLASVFMLLWLRVIFFLQKPKVAHGNVLPKKIVFSLAVVTLTYLIFWVPWLFSPRIMFLYHYLPALPFLYLLLSYFLIIFVGKRTTTFIAAACFIFFLIFLPHLNGLPVPIWLDNFYYFLPSWR